MRVAVFSDLHLGRGDRTDRFGHDPARFHRFLDHLEGISDQVVVLGDLADTHHGRVPLAFFRELQIICDVHVGLVDRLLGGRYRVIAGNHDSCLLSLPGIESEWVLDRDDFRVLMFHGHQFDRLINASATLCALGNYLGGTAERYGVKGALALLDWIDDAANGVTVDRNELYCERALARAVADGVDAVILGHLHRQDLVTEGGVTYANCGACLEGRFEYAFIDTARRLVEVRTW